MELRHLRYFVAVAEEENVTRAAARLHVSQPPLTRQVRDLEAELGFDLFTRSGKSLRLTDAGRVFLEEARAVLARLDAAVAAARATASGHAGELHVGYAPSPTIGVLPTALQEFQRASPRVRVRLHDQTTPQMLAGLRDRSLHVALMMQPPKQAAVDVVFEPLRAFPIMVATATRHPLARKRRVTVPELLREPVVVLARKEYADYHALLGRILGDDAKRLRIVEECDGGMSLIAAVESGRGVALTIAALGDVAGRRLRFVPLEPAPPQAVVGVAYREDALTPLVRAFVAAVKAGATLRDAR